MPDKLQALGWGTALGVAWGVAWGVGWKIILGIGSTLILGIVLVILLGLQWRLAWRAGWIVASGAASGVALGVVMGVLFGIGWAVSNNDHLVEYLGILFLLVPAIVWVVELVWMSVLFLISLRGDAASLLLYLPARFDQRIILPLPFMSGMIATAYLQNQAIARETIHYLIYSTNQQKIATEAIAKIALGNLKECQTLDDIAEVAHRLDWIPSPISKEMNWVVPKFLDISQNISSAINASSIYRGYQTLQDSIHDLWEIINSLSASRKNSHSSLAVIYGGIAESWLKLLEMKKSEWRKEAIDTEEIRQVYITGSALDPDKAQERFKGRHKIFREIDTLALSEPPPALLLYGGRRTGKTSALKYLPRRIGANLVPLLVDIQGAAAATTLTGLAQQISKQIIDSARKLPRRLELPRPNEKKLEKDPFIALQDWLEQIERIAPPGKRFLLCLDEYERLSEVIDATGSKAPLNFFRYILQHMPSWTILFSGSHELSDLPTYWSDYLINTRALRMTYLQESEARELILQPVKDFATTIYEDDAVDEIIQITHCQPYLVQLVCFEIIELLNEKIRIEKRTRGTTKASVGDVQAAISTVLVSGDQYFRELWDRLQDEEQKFLYRLLDGEKPTTEDKLIVRSLLRKEVLKQEGVGEKGSDIFGQLSFQVPLFGRYVQM